MKTNKQSVLEGEKRVEGRTKRERKGSPSTTRILRLELSSFCPGELSVTSFAFSSTEKLILKTRYRGGKKRGGKRVENEERERDETHL